MLLKPGTENQEYWFMFNGIDKTLHLSIFLVLGYTFRTSFPKLRFYYFVQIMLIYAFLTEILQEEMHWGRSMETLDVVADIIGVLLGYSIYQKLNNRYF